MAMIDLIATARDDTFAARVAMILMTLAINIMNEDPTTPNHANRMILANMHMKGMVNCKLIAAAVIAYNPTIQTEIESSPASLGSTCPDGDLNYVLSGLYNNIANAYSS